MISVIVVGFVMITLGTALLLLGEVPILPGKRIPALRARLVGVILVLFLPLSLSAVLTCDLIFGRGAVEGPVITWVLFALCWLTIVAMLFRVIVPKKDRKAARTVAPVGMGKKNPFAEPEPISAPLPVDILEEATSEPMEPAQKPAKVKPALKKSAPKSVANDNPFDFS